MLLVYSCHFMIRLSNRIVSMICKINKGHSNFPFRFFSADSSALYSFCGVNSNTINHGLCFYSITQE